MKIELISPIHTWKLPTYENIPIPENLSDLINGRITLRALVEKLNESLK